ncbi:MAG: cryptochrome/photolyase family protein, partial [Rickettsiales bacterium]|nr:cryptochrome/photolyase family protein [Rickettsiales bacterium]
MKTLRLILGDQLSQSISSLKGYNADTDIILMCEVWDEATYVKHHKKKIAFLFSAMRHFAEALKNKGFNVEYTTLDHPENTGSFSGEIKRMLATYQVDRIIVTQPGEYRVLAELQGLEDELSIAIEIRDDDRFL